MSYTKKTSPELTLKSVTKQTHLGKEIGAVITFLLRKDSGEEWEELVNINCTPTEFLGSKMFYTELENRGVIFYDTSNKYRNSLLEQLHMVEITKMEILNQGVNVLETGRMCLLGDTLIVSDDLRLNVAEEYKQYKIAQKASVPFDFIHNFMHLAPACPVALTYFAVSVLEGYFAAEPWNGSRCVCVLEGQTGTYKSTLARMITNFNFQQGTLTLGSTKASLETRLGTADNIPVLLDDFNISAYGNSKKGYVLTEIIQAFADRHKVERRQGKAVVGSSMGGGIFITAEAMPKNHSTLNRCLIVEVTPDTPIDTMKLSLLQEQSQRVMTELVIGFNQYILDNYDDIKKVHQTQIQSYRNKKIFYPYNDKNVYGYSRIINTYAVTKSAAGILCQFFRNKLLEEELVSEYKKMMYSSIYSACDRLCGRLSLGAEIISSVLDTFLRDLEEQSFACSEAEYYKKKERSIGIMQDEILYVRGKRIDDLIQLNGREFTRDRVIKALESFCLLCIDFDGRKSVHLPGGERKTRYYAIRYFELQDLIRKQREAHSDYVDGLVQSQITVGEDW